MSIASAFIGESSYHLHENNKDPLSDNNPTPHAPLTMYQLDTITLADSHNSPHHPLSPNVPSPNKPIALVRTLMSDPMNVAGALTPALVLVPELRTVSLF